MTKETRYPAFQLVPPGKLLERLLDAIDRGVKTATSALVVSLEMNGISLPRVGDRYTLINSHDESHCDIEVTEVRVEKIVDVGVDVALAEGDWFESVEQWREAHERYFNGFSQSIAEHLGRSEWQVEDDTLVVIRFFRKI